MSESIKLLLVKTPEAAPQAVDVSIEDLRDAILNHPDAVVAALREALAAGGGAQAVSPGDIGVYPADTPIFKLLGPDQAALLTANAAKLTKADVVALQLHQKTPSQLNLTTADLQSLQNAFSFVFPDGKLPSGLAKASADVSCCCCTPCCTAAAVIKPVRVS